MVASNNNGFALKQDVIDAVKMTSNGLKGYLAKELGIASEKVDKRFDELDSQMAMRLGKVLDKEVSVRVEEFRKIYDERIQELQKEILSIRAFYETGLRQIQDFLKSMPATQLIIPENSIQINQSPAIMTVPENAIKVEVGKVEVNVPQQQPPTVEVNIPPPRKTRKKIEYDMDGRPTEIEEVEI